MISVLIATYNGTKYLKDQMDSIKNQTRESDEVIFSDDFSKDGTVEFINTYIKTHNLYNWKVIENSKNMGHYMNFMNSLQYIKGDFVFFGDQDDIWDVNKIKIMTDIMMSHKDITCLKSRYSSIDAKTKYNNINMENHNISLSYPDYFQQMTNSELGCQMCFRKEVIQFALIHKITDYSSFNYHDLLLSYISSAIGKNAIVECELLYHRYHENNATKKSTYKYCQDTRINRIKLIDTQSARMQSLLDIIEKYKIKNDELIKIILKILNNNSARVNFLKGNLLMVFKISANIKCYKEIKTYFGDLLCGFGINRIFRRN